MKKETLDFFRSCTDLYVEMVSSGADPYVMRKDYRNIAPVHAISEASFQASIRKRVRKKYFRYEMMAHTPKSIEQASSEKCSRYVSGLFNEIDEIADLCCGAGGNTLCFTTVARKVHAWDWDEDTLNTAVFNTILFGVNNTEFRVEDTALWQKSIDGIFIDPDRRPKGKRITGLEGISPSWAEIKRLKSFTPHLLVKLGPGTRINILLHEQPSNLHFLEEKGVLRQILFEYKQNSFSKRTMIKCSNLDFGVTMEMESDIVVPNQEIHAELPDPIPDWIVELSPSVMKSGIGIIEATNAGMIPANDSGAYWYAFGEHGKLNYFSQWYEIVAGPFKNIERIKKELTGMNASEIIIKSRGVTWSNHDIKRIKSIKKSEEGVPVILFVFLSNGKRLFLITTRNSSIHIPGGSVNFND